jgi:hypothetical protein
MIPAWINAEIYKAVQQLQERLISLQQEGNIVVNQEGAYFQRNDEVIVVENKPLSRSLQIANYLEKYAVDLFRIRSDPYPTVACPYNEEDSLDEKAWKVFQMLQQRRVARDRIKTLCFYFLMGKLYQENGQQHFTCLSLPVKRANKLRWKSTRTYQLLGRVGEEQIYHTEFLSVKVITEMAKEQYDELLGIIGQLQLTVSQELNA